MVFIVNFLIGTGYRFSPGNELPSLASVGTLAEVFSYKEDTDSLFETLCVKAMGRQRFQIEETRRQADG